MSDKESDMTSAEAWFLLAIIVLAVVGMVAGAYLLIEKGDWIKQEIGWTENRHERIISQEQRHAEIVKAAPPPKAPIVVKIKSKRSGCIEITRAEIDGGDLWVYLTNVCSIGQAYVELHWQAFAPDGTIVVSGRDYIEDPDYGLDSGQKAEMHIERMRSDPRIVSITVLATSQER